MPRLRKRSWISLAVLLALAWLFFSLWLIHDPVNETNFRRIAEGMSLDEVEHLLGGKGQPTEFLMADRLRAREESLTSWVGHEAIIEVWFRNGKVESKTFREQSSGSIQSRLRRWWMSYKQRLQSDNLS